MADSVKHRIESLAALGDRLAVFGRDADSRAAIGRAIDANKWFSTEDIELSIRAIREQMLSREKLDQWISAYADYGDGIDAHGKKKLGIIMAGNIPAAGFFDLLCGLVCGWECHVKMSGKDAALISYIITLLQNTGADFQIRSQIACQPDALIASGSDNSVRHIRHQWPGVPALLRGSRYSAAVIDGKENENEIRAIAKDIFTYNGMGCRSVSHLHLPDGYDLHRLVGILSDSSLSVNPKYLNNYLQNRALATMYDNKIVDGGFFTMRESDDFPTFISEITYSHYSTRQQLGEWINSHRDKLQCIVSAHPEAGYVPAGRAQFPRLRDYPDMADVIEFLSNNNTRLITTN